MRTVLYVGILMCFSNLVWAQKEEVKSIQITFDSNQNPEITNLAKDIKPGDYFQVEIDNINTYLYKFQIDGEDVVIAPENLPASIVDIFKFEGLDNILSNISTIVQGVVPDAMEYTEEREGGKNKGIDSLFYQPKTDYSVEDVGFHLLMLQMASADPKADEAVNIAEGILNYYGLIYRDQYITLKSFRDRLNTLYQTVSNFQHALHYAHRTAALQNFDQEKINQLLNNLQSLRNNINMHIQKIDETNLSLESFTTTYKEYLEAQKDLKKQMGELKTVQEEMNKAADTLQKQVSPEKYVELQTGLATLYNHKGFKYTSFPMQLTADGKKLTIKAEPRAENSNLISYNTIVQIPNQSKNYWGVSTGLYLTKNQNENYTLMSDVRTIEPEEPAEGEEPEDPVEKTYYSLVEERKAESEAGIKLMVHRAWHLGNFDTLGDIFFTTGIGGGLSITEKPKPRIFFGPGFAVGDKNKFTIDFGGVYMFYDVLSNGYDTETEYTATPTDYMVTLSQIRGYVSVGYTIKLGE